MRFPILLLLSCITTVAFSQEFGGNPPSIKWLQVNTDTARVIFPAGLEETGKRVASIIHEEQRNHATLGHHLRKISIVLQNQTTNSNAYVALGPYRSEFYLFAPQNSFDLGSLNWAEDLSMHEYRHVQQYSNFNVGLSKVASILFGQQGQALANAAAIPDWFFEGDAVFNETSLTQQGRGRLPFFFSGYKSLFELHKNYSYMKLRNGSYRDYVPNHYELGYLLVAYGREKYGADFWRKVTQDAARFKPLIYPWQGAVQHYAKVPYKQFVSDAFTFYKSMWQVNDNPITYITPIQKHNVTNYKYPHLDSAGNIIVLKSSYRRIPAFFRISPSGEEERIGTRGISNDDYFSYNNGQIVYATYRADKRWGYREFSDINIMDASTGQSTRITSSERYVSPDISHDGQHIIAVNMPYNQSSHLVALDLEGKVTFRSKATRGIIYTYPKFSSDDKSIYSAIRNDEGKMSLIKVDLATGKETTLFPFINSIIGFLTVQGDDSFLFTISYKGRDEVWGYLESKKRVYQIASHPTGLYHAVYDRANKRVIASNFTADGYRLVSFADPALTNPLPSTEGFLPDLYVTNALKQEDSSTLNYIITRDFAITRYPKAHGFLNYHTWRPYYDNPEFTISLLGENVLNTVQSDISYTYNRNERSHRGSFNIIYGGWYVQPLAGISQTWDRHVTLNDNSTAYYNEFNAHAGLRLPLNFSGGNQYRYLTLTSTANNQQVRWTGTAKSLLQNLSFNYLDTRLQYSSQIQQALQHIYPHWGQTFTIQHRNIINKYTAHQTLLSANFYLPGFLPTHSIVLGAAYQTRDTVNQYSFSNNFPFSRGYSGLNYPRMYRLSANYHLPLLYPDFGIANIVYFKRIRANGFYDYSQIKSLRTGRTYQLRTTGAELYFDTKWWNQQDGITFGIRYSHLQDAQLVGMSPNQWEFILPISIL